MDQLDFQDLQDQKETGETLARGGQPGHQDFWDLKDQEDFQEKLGSLALQDLQGHLHPQACRSLSNKGFSTRCSPRLKKKMENPSWLPPS